MVLVSVEHGTLFIFMNVIAQHSDISGVVNTVNKSESKRMQCMPKDSNGDACLKVELVSFSVYCRQVLSDSARSRK
jgi:hypothetical protein